MQERTEDSLWSAIRALEEHVLLLRHMADHLGDGASETTSDLRRRADQAASHAELVRKAVLAHPEMAEIAAS
jgi:hypothetical protein